MGLSGLIPLILLFVVVGIGGFVGYSLYTWSGELADRGRKKLEKKNLAFTPDGGLRVGVKELRDENYADKTQSVLVNVWNHASLPNYKSRLGWNTTQDQPTVSGKKGGASRPTNSRNESSSYTTTTTSSSSGSAKLAPPSGKRGARSSSPVPGGWD